ncbi:MAG: hypothetical protein WCO00_15110 [Rhodospirillaceae bacterium]
MALTTDFLSLPRASLETMAAAGREVRNWERILEKTGDTMVSEVTRAAAKLPEWEHYPPGDVYDRDHHAQYYFHIHPASERPYGEFGHFHTFLRGPGMPSADTVEAVCHLIAVGVDRRGCPMRLFTTNRWVTDEIWYDAVEVACMLDGFTIDHARPSWPVNRWITALLRLFRPQIMSLLAERDRAIRAWASDHPGVNVLEDRALEVPSETGISVEGQLSAVERALAWIS